MPKGNEMRGSSLGIIFLAIALLGVVGCREPKESVVLNNAPQPVVPNDWQFTVIEDVGFSFATPPDWEIQRLSKAELEEALRAQNAEIWAMLGGKKASVDFDRSVGLMGFKFDFSEGGGMSLQMILGIREETDEMLAIQDAADKWRDTLRSGYDAPPITEERVELPVGPAQMLQVSESTSFGSDRTTVYSLVDGTVRYSFFFYETAFGGASPMPAREIMETFRVRR